MIDPPPQLIARLQEVIYPSCEDWEREIAESECAVVAFEAVLNWQEQHINQYRTKIEAMENLYNNFENMIRQREEMMEAEIRNEQDITPSEVLRTAEENYDKLQRLEEMVEDGDFYRCAEVLDEVRMQLDEL
jgi:hypothetical protein